MNELYSHGELYMCRLQPSRGMLLTTFGVAKNVEVTEKLLKCSAYKKIQGQCLRAVSVITCSRKFQHMFKIQSWCTAKKIISGELVMELCADVVYSQGQQQNSDN